jgi:hypothetical protein
VADTDTNGRPKQSPRPSAAKTGVARPGREHDLIDAFVNEFANAIKDVFGGLRDCARFTLSRRYAAIS